MNAFKQQGGILRRLQVQIRVVRRTIVGLMIFGIYLTGSSGIYCSICHISSLKLSKLSSNKTCPAQAFPFRTTLGVFLQSAAGFEVGLSRAVM